MTKRNALLAGTDRAPLGSAVFWKSRFARYFESFRLAFATTRSGPRAVIYAARLYPLRKSRACALAATRVRNVSPMAIEAWRNALRPGLRGTVRIWRPADMSGAPCEWLGGMPMDTAPVDYFRIKP